LDNSERHHYKRRAKDLLPGWERRVLFGPGPYDTYFWETAFGGG
jgi:hypothetical protein